MIEKGDLVIKRGKHEAKVWMFCTEDKEKAERILSIIEEG